MALAAAAAAAAAAAVESRGERQVVCCGSPRPKGGSHRATAPSGAPGRLPAEGGEGSCPSGERRCAAWRGRPRSRHRRPRSTRRRRRRRASPRAPAGSRGLATRSRRARRRSRRAGGAPRVACKPSAPSRPPRRPKREAPEGRVVDVSWTCRGRVQSAARSERLLLESGEQGREELLQRRVGAEPPRAAAVATDGAEGARGVAANARVAERAEDGLHAPLQRLRPLGWGEPRRKSRDAAQSGGAQVRRSPIPYSTRRGEGSLDRRSERALLRSVGKRVRRLGGASRSCRRLAAVSAATVPAAPRIGRRSQVPAR